MLGAIIGDIVGSRFEWQNNKSKEFELLTYKCEPTDDSIMSLAIAASILECNGDLTKLGKIAIAKMQELGQAYPDAGYGGHFRAWIYEDNPAPYNSWGNGAAMRVSACGFAADNIQESIDMADAVTSVTHNHPEGMKAAEAVAAAIFMAKNGSSLIDIRDYIESNYYKINFTLDGIRETYRDREKFCVNLNKYFQSDETQRTRAKSERKYFSWKKHQKNSYATSSTASISQAPRTS